MLFGLSILFFMAFTFRFNLKIMAETDLENQQTKAQDGKSPEASPEKNTDKRFVISCV